MNMFDILTAKDEAERFLECYKRFNDRIVNDKVFADYWKITGGKETAALKRSSLDLTRALSFMRGNR
jgi:hypothetical protein